MAPTPVPAPPLTPPRYSLLTIAGQIGGDWPIGWQDAITWEPECPDWRVPIRPGCGSLDAEEPAEGRSRPEVSALMLHARDECSTFTNRDWQGRARRQLAAIESSQLAAQVWWGAATRDIGTDPSPYLFDGTAAVATAPSGADLVGQIAALEATAITAGIAGRIWLHMSPHLFHLYVAAAGPMVQVQGGVATTVLGSVLATDAGYLGIDPEASPAQTTETVFATGPVAVKLGPVEVVGGDDNDPSAYDIARNQRIVYARRMATYQIEACEKLVLTTDVPVIPALT